AIAACTRDDVVEAIAVHIADRHVDATGESRIISEEAEEFFASRTIPDADVWSAACARCRDDDRCRTFAIDVAGRHSHATAKAAAISQEAQGLRVVIDVADRNHRRRSCVFSSRVDADGGVAKVTSGGLVDTADRGEGILSTQGCSNAPAILWRLGQGVVT